MDADQGGRTIAVTAHEQRSRFDEQPSRPSGLRRWLRRLLETPDARRRRVLAERAARLARRERARRAAP
jgi:hypothetical protein